MRVLALCCALCVLGGIGGLLAAKRAGAADGTAAARAAQAAPALQIGRYQRIVWHWQHVMGKPRTPSSFSAQHSPDPAYRAWVARLWQQRAHRTQRQAAAWLTGRIHTYQTAVAHWQRVMGLRPRPLRQTAGIVRALSERHALMTRWRLRARRLEQRAAHPPFAAAWRCIHRYEGAWTDANGPYYGGLQMDLTFQRRYGRYLLRTKGTAEHWTPAEQMWVATRALRSGRGFYPWPNTARACGLI